MPGACVPNDHTAQMKIEQYDVSAKAILRTGGLGSPSHATELHKASTLACFGILKSIYAFKLHFVCYAFIQSFFPSSNTNDSDGQDFLHKDTGPWALPGGSGTGAGKA